jgi:hypothetical protein
MLSTKEIMEYVQGRKDAGEKKLLAAMKQDAERAKTTPHKGGQ